MTFTLASFVTDRPNILSLGSMRSLIAIAAFLLALFVAAAPVEAMCGSGGEAAVAAGATQSAVDVIAVATGGHCQHVPCSDSTHDHMPGECAGHSFVATFAFESPRIAIAKRRVAFTHDNFNGRTLLPPVPPPLA
ncbi:MAG: hypothetical protein HOP13_03330 [Alphaproteobacteria bacterium]|nr:hypothetical protein [Alphaproteobacteria bacterium]